MRFEKSGYRDREKYTRTRRKGQKKYYDKTAYAENYRERWSDDEIELIMRHEITDHEVSELLGRSVRSIQIKRSRMKAKAGERNG